MAITGQEIKNKITDLYKNYVGGFVEAEIKSLLTDIVVFIEGGTVSQYGKRKLLSGSVIDWAEGVDVYTKTITAPLIITDANLPSGDKTKLITVIISGAFTVTLPAYYVWKGGVADGISDKYVFDCINGSAGEKRVEYTIIPNA